MTDWHLAQINVAHARYPLDDSRIAAFVAQLDEVNALAERSPGFVWRLQGDSGNATDIEVENDPNAIVNMSLWRNAEVLFDFVYKSAHRPVMTRRREWFLPPEGAYQALWWVEAGRTPTLQEGASGAPGPERPERAGLQLQDALSSARPSRRAARSRARALLRRLGIAVLGTARQV